MNRAPVLDCEPVTRRAFDVLEEPPIPVLAPKIVPPATPSVPVLEEFTKMAAPPIKRAPVLDCEPFTRRALEVFDALLIPMLPVELIPGDEKVTAVPFCLRVPV